MTMTIYVLDCGDLFFELFNVIAAFMKSSTFLRLVEISAAFGLFVAALRCFKTLNNPMVIVKWLVLYVLVFNIVMIPKTSVTIYDVTTQKTYAVDNVPMAFAFIAQGLTGLGYGLAQIFDMLFSTPDSIQYSKTGFLFGSKLIQESRNFRVTDPGLKADLSMYFKRCVVGDLYLSHVLSPTELKESPNIWQSISSSPSKIRRTLVLDKGGIRVNRTCADATPILKSRLQQEIKRAYTIFGINLFGKPEHTNYESLFSTHLSSAFNYYQAIQTSGSDAFLQAMMLNLIKDGVSDYQSYLNSTASVMTHEFSKSQAQQRYSWEIGGLKSAWLWPFFHSVVMFLVMALFPLIILFVIAYNGVDALKSYLIFFLSLQLWPVLFAVLNFVMAFYGSSISSNYKAITLANLDNIEQLHSEVASVAGYMMVFIPWLAYGLVTRLGESFNSLSTSMISGLQSSTMSAASEAANASFSLGQSSFYNATGNTLSANKHDTNFTSMSGNTTRMLDSGVTLTKTSDGGEIIDASSAVSRGSISVNANQAISGMLNQASELTTQAISSQSKQLSSVISEGSNHLTQFSELQGKDLRLGDGVSESENTQVQKAVSNILGVASSVADRTGVSNEQALTGLINAGVTTQVGINTNRSIGGKLAGWAFGADGSIYARAGYDKSDSTSHRSHEGVEKVLDSKQMQDFRDDLSYVQNFSQTHHLDTSHSKGASLLSQVSGDFRQAQQVSSSLDANYSRAERIATAQSVTESGGAGITQNLDQLFAEYVTDKVGDSERNYLYGHPGDASAHAKLSSLANDFVSDAGIRDKIIDTYGNASHSINPKASFAEGVKSVQVSEQELYQKYFGNKHTLQQQANAQDVGFNTNSAQSLENKVHRNIESQQHKTQEARVELQSKSKIQINEAENKLVHGRKESNLSSLLKGD